MFELDYKVLDIRSAAVLTNSYVAGTVIEPLAATGVLPEKLNQIVLLVDFTIGGLTSAEIKVEFSADNTNWYHETIEQAPTAGVSIAAQYVRQLTGTGAFRFAFPIKDRYIRISSKGTGAVAASSLAIKGVIGTA